MPSDKRTGSGVREESNLPLRSLPYVNGLTCCQTCISPSCGTRQPDHPRSVAPTTRHINMIAPTMVLTSTLIVITTFSEVVDMTHAENTHALLQISPAYGLFTSKIACINRRKLEVLQLYPQRYCQSIGLSKLRYLELFPTLQRRLVGNDARHGECQGLADINRRLAIVHQGVYELVSQEGMRSPMTAGMT